MNMDWLRKFGPGLFFAAVAIGVSHLVQSTRAGALYGFGMLVFIVLGLATKYPTFRFGQQYATATGFSLLEGFRRQGRWALGLYAFIALATVFTGLAAVALMTAGLLQYSLGFVASPQVIGGSLIAVCSLLILIGGYHRLDIFMKVLMLLLVIITVSATAMALPKIQWSGSSSLMAIDFTPAVWLFVATLVGWMPAPLDAAVMQSLWTLEKSGDLEQRLTWRQASVDFHTGYFLTALIAVCFLLLGTAIMRGSEADLSGSATDFSIQLIDMYEQVLGPWSRSLIAVTTLAVMLSTALMMLDGYSRSIATLVFHTLRAGQTKKSDSEQLSVREVAAVMLLLNIGAMSVLFFFMRSFTTMLAIATTVSFIAAPLLAWLTHRAMVADEVPTERRIGPALKLYSQVCIVSLTLFTLGYLYLAASW